MFKKLYLHIKNISLMPYDFFSNLSLSNYRKETKLLELVTNAATKPPLSGNMLPNEKSITHAELDG